MTEPLKVSASRLVKIWKKRTPFLTRLIFLNGFRKVDKVLNSYIDKLAKLKYPAAEDQIMSIVESSIEELNKINEKHPLIDTLERDDLCDFISTGAQAAGLKIKNGEDITVNYRDW